MGSVRQIKSRRADTRMAVDMQVVLRRYGARPQPTKMSDVSAAGALVTGDDVDLVKGDEVILDIGTYVSVVATVAWATDRHAGLAFHKRLSDFQVSAVLAVRSAPEPRGEMVPGEPIPTHLGF